MKQMGLMIPFLLGTTMGFAMADSSLEEIVQTRVAGDRSGVCVAVARVGTAVETAFVCADPEQARAIDDDSRFEIGSLSKALQGVLIARLVEQEKLDLDLTLADVLGESVPRFAEQPIRLRHLLTHTSGLPRVPAGMPMSDPANPYADLTAEHLLSALADTELTTAPGERWEYSNFGTMLLSLAIARHSGDDLDVLLQRELFGPLQMRNTAIGGPVIDGHDANGNKVPGWDFATNLAGVGGIRSSLDDMVRFMQAALGQGPDAITNAIAQSFETLSNTGQPMGWGWVQVPVNEQVLMVHDGGTYGFSSFMAIDPQRGVASVVLSDTSMLSQNSLGDLALHLIDPEVPLGAPRQQSRAAVARPENLNVADYVGDYPLYDRSRSP